MVDDAAEKVEVLVAFHVPQILHRTVVGDERVLVIIGHRRPDEFLVLADDFFTSGGNDCFRRGGHARPFIICCADCFGNRTACAKSRRRIKINSATGRYITAVPVQTFARSLLPRRAVQQGRAIAAITSPQKYRRSWG